MPADLSVALDELEGRTATVGKASKIAVFDMDNTLLIGDIGDALFAYLKEMEKTAPVTIDRSAIPLSWNEYQEMIGTMGKRAAYTRVVSAMVNIPTQTVTNASLAVLKDSRRTIPVEGIEVLKPYPNRVMASLLRYLKAKDYAIFIISATNRLTVEATARVCFGIPASHIAGMDPVIRQDQRFGAVLTAEVREPVTVGPGKVEAYRKLIGTTPPLLSGGDSDSDLDMINLTANIGLGILVTSTRDKFATLSTLLKPDLPLFHLEA